MALPSISTDRTIDPANHERPAFSSVLLSRSNCRRRRFLVGLFPSRRFLSTGLGDEEEKRGPFGGEGGFFGGEGDLFGGEDDFLEGENGLFGRGGDDGLFGGKGGLLPTAE